MQLTYNGKDYDIVIEKKRGQKNTYIRVKRYEDNSNNWFFY